MSGQPTAPPPSYNESLQGNSGYPGGGYQYGAVSGQPAGAYQPGYSPAGSYNYPKPGQYDPNKPPGPYPPQAGYPAGGVPSYNQHTTTVVQSPTQSVVVVGGCPACRVGILEEDFTCCGVLLAILFFPIGVLCCLAMRQRRCANCGAVFG